jgi:sugar (pentulose or hexulose) kinase
MSRLPGCRMKTVIAVDIGTTSLRATLYDEQGAALHAEQRHNPPTYLTTGGWNKTRLRG